MADLSQLFGANLGVQPRRRQGPFDLAGPKQAEFTRKLVMSEAMKQDLAPDDGLPFYQFVTERLAQLGDGEGAMAVGQQFQALQAAQAQAQAEAEQQQFDNMDTNRKFGLKEKTDLGNLGVSRQNANSSSLNAASSAQNANTNAGTLGLNRDKFNADAGMRAQDERGARIDNELERYKLDYLAEFGHLPPTATEAAKLGVGGAGGSPAEDPLGEFGSMATIEESMRQAYALIQANPGGVTGVRASIKTALDGLARQAGFDVSMDAEQLETYMNAIAGQAGPFLLQDKRALAVAERERVEKMIKRPNWKTDSKSIVESLNFLNNMIAKMEAYLANKSGRGRNNPPGPTGPSGGGTPRVIDFNDLAD